MFKKIMLIVLMLGFAALIFTVTVKTDEAGQVRHISNSVRLINRGRYLVENVGKCADCHTPRDRFGRPIKSKWLEGTVLNLKPIHPIPGWAGKTPDIAGLPKGWTRKDMIKFLTTGIDTKGRYARPPMPSYRLTKEDAVAVTDYLENLSSKNK
jgi:mono/diheme cytochrome c family protein